MNFKKSLWIGFLILEFGLHGAAAAMADVVVVGNLANQSTLTQDQVVKIFLGKARQFPNGTVVKPVDQAEGRQPRQEFLEKFLNKSEMALKSYWSGLVFTGNGVPPDTLGDDEAVKKFVAAQPNALGYIDSKALDSSVKILYKPTN